uniref:Leucine rich immune protein (Coil-less) n=1 Tax=Anopheles farauti TaxID=69004 RepID=A0A182QLW0_9DIPT
MEYNPRQFVVAIVLLLFGSAARGFKFVCRELQTHCVLSDWNPKEEGYFVLKHIPASRRRVELHNLQISILEERFCEEMGRAGKGIYIESASQLTTISYPHACTIGKLSVRETKVNHIGFERNVHLWRIVLKRCPIRELPPSLTNLPNLKMIEVHSTNIDRIDMDLLCALRNAKSLIMKRNKLSQVVGNDNVKVCNTSLTELNLSRNQLRTINLRVFAPFVRLQELNLSRNKLVSLSGSLHNIALKYFDLSNNRLNEINMCSWTLLPIIRTFDVEHNNLRYVPRCVDRIENVLGIDFGNNKIVDPQIEQFTHFPRLQMLTYNHNRVVQVPLNESVYPASLKVISFYENPVNNSSIPEGTFERIVTSFGKYYINFQAANEFMPTTNSDTSDETTNSEK